MDPDILSKSQTGAPVKLCTKCGTEKSVDRMVRDSTRADGVKKICKPCHALVQRAWVKSDPQHALAIARSWREADPDRLQSYRLRKYNISLEHYRSMFIQQSGKCAVCTVEFGDCKKTSPRVDHGHKCCPGQSSCGSCIRGLLCDRCNVVLGRMQDDIAILEKGIAYLRSFQKEETSCSDKMISFVPSLYSLDGDGEKSMAVI